MNPLQQEHKSVSLQVDTIMANRNRRFKWLMKKDRIDDAIAVGEEFMEWMLLDQEDCDEEILYFRIDDLQNVE
jgi:hypothetical protein|tara:strand:+ start:76 stop:294 length:219 start_codon:yes stop_codon:yes gene_type:complete